METKLAHWRVYRGFSQKQLAKRTGIRLSTLQRLEQGAAKRPPDISRLQNCAIALGCQLTDLLEDELLEWTPLPGGPTTPPEPDSEWPPGPPPTLATASRIPSKLRRDALAITRKPIGARALRDTWRRTDV
jgi:transcriptional regulator with XRE-family HTH domain